MKPNSLRVIRILVGSVICVAEADSLWWGLKLWPPNEPISWLVLAPFWLPALLALYSICRGLTAGRRSHWALTVACAIVVASAVAEIWMYGGIPRHGRVDLYAFEYYLALAAAVLGLWLAWLGRRPRE